MLSMVLTVPHIRRFASVGQPYARAAFLWLVLHLVIIKLRLVGKSCCRVGRGRGGESSVHGRGPVLVVS